MAPFSFSCSAGAKQGKRLVRRPKDDVGVVVRLLPVFGWPGCPCLLFHRGFKASGSIDQKRREEKRRRCDLRPGQSLVLRCPFPYFSAGVQSKARVSSTDQKMHLPSSRRLLLGGGGVRFSCRLPSFYSRWVRKAAFDRPEEKRRRPDLRFCWWPSAAAVVGEVIGRAGRQREAVNARAFRGTFLLSDHVWLS